MRADGACDLGRARANGTQELAIFNVLTFVAMTSPRALMYMLPITQRLWDEGLRALLVAIDIVAVITSPATQQKLQSR